MEVLVMVNFKIGDIVEHLLNKDWLMVLEVYDDKIKCRTKDLSIIEFSSFEVKKK